MMTHRPLLKYWVTSGAMFVGAMCGGLVGIILDAALYRGSAGMLMLIPIGLSLGSLIGLGVVLFQSGLRMCLLIGAVIGVLGFISGVVLDAWPISWFGLGVTVPPSLAFALCGWIVLSPSQKHAR